MIAATAIVPGVEHPSAWHAARAWAAREGVAGRKGGWLYRANGTPLCHGWGQLVGILTRQGAIRDLDGRSLGTISGGSLNGRVRRNVFDGEPVVLVDAAAEKRWA